MAKPPKLHEYVGAVHIHTRDSDGSKTHSEIIDIARKLHLDFLIFTDHMTMKHREIEGWHNHLLALVGYEIHDPEDKNHYLAFDVDRVVPEGLTAPEYVRKVRDQKGIGIIAHPDEIREKNDIPAYPWTAWGEVKNFDGIEVWNHMSAWLEGMDKNHKLKAFLHPRSSLTAPSKQTLEHWDRAAMQRRVIGIGSLDAHAAEYYLGPIRLTIFPYKVQLQSIRTHVLTTRPLLTDDFPGSKKQFYRSVRNARLFISNYRWGNARDFRFWCESKRQYAFVGGAMRYHPSIVFKVSSPAPGTIRMVYRGKVVEEVKGSSAEFPVREDGPYRVEVLKDGVGWIYSNHIKILPSRRLRRRKKSRKKGKG